MACMNLRMRTCIKEAQETPESLQKNELDTSRKAIDDLKMEALTSEQAVIAKDVLKQYTQLWHGGATGKHLVVKHRIRLDTDTPIRMPPRYFGEDERKTARAELDKMLKAGVVRPSNSPFASEVVLVQKVGGSWRFCIDFRALNKSTIADSYPMPRIADLLAAVGGSKYFVALDLRAGYWQIAMEEESIKYTAFRCAGGLWEFTRMPFGLKNAPATFQRAMDALLDDKRYDGILVYLDDVLIHAHTFDAALDKLRLVSGRLLEAGLTINLQKCDVFPVKIKYLGHIIGPEGMMPNKNPRSGALSRIKPAKNVSELRSILGLLTYYSVYVPNYAQRVLPISNLLLGIPPKNAKKKSQFPVNWTSDCDEALTDVLGSLENATLYIPWEQQDKDAPYLLECDASDHTIAAAFHIKDSTTQAWRPVGFTSKKLNVTQQNWPIREKQAFAIVHGLDHFDCFLRGRRVGVTTDHETLRMLKSAKKGKVARWATRLAEYDLDVYWKKGEHMEHIDALTRQVEPEDFTQDRMFFAAIHTRKRQRVQDKIEADALNQAAPPEVYDITDGEDESLERVEVCINEKKQQDEYDVDVVLCWNN